MNNKSEMILLLRKFTSNYSKQNSNNNTMFYIVLESEFFYCLTIQTGLQNNKQQHLL